MNFQEIYRHFSISFEIFPPKTPEGEKNLFNELEVLMKYKPAFVSVTYGAGGSTREKTLDLAVKIREKFSITPLVHFTCVGAGRTEIGEYLERVRSLGLTDILALRGDPPKGQTNFSPAPDGFSYASELVSFIKERGGFSIAVAGYPEGHPTSPDFDTDLQNLKRKIDAGSDLVLSQLFFDTTDFFRLRDGLARIGSNAIVIPGIMPITSLSQLEGTIKSCGAKVPQELADKFSLARSPEEVMSVGIDHAIKQCTKLIEGGVKGFHLYPLNKSAVISKILDAIDLPRRQ
ncbi:MAG TPA: methylenetetrahydrofolate reductase [NAD(P)H] [Spirochaetota bacterium]